MSDFAQSGSLTEMIRVARQGSKEAVGQLLDSFRHTLSYLVKRRLAKKLQSKESASDLIQQSFATAYENFERFQGNTPDEFRAWLREILHHHLEHFYRAYQSTAKRDVCREVPLAKVDPRTGVPLEVTLTSPTPPPWEAADGEDRQERLKRAYALLPPEGQQIIRWRFWERASFKQIAKRLQCSEEAARSRHRRALRILGEILSDRAPSPGSAPPNAPTTPPTSITMPNSPTGCHS